MPFIQPESPLAISKAFLLMIHGIRTAASISALRTGLVLLAVVVFTAALPPVAALSQEGSSTLAAVKQIAENTGNAEDKGEKTKEKKIEHPYEDRKTPEAVGGWINYLTYFPLYKTGGEWIRLHSLVTAIVILVAGIWLAILCGRLLKKALSFRFIPSHIAIAFSQIVVYLLIFFVVLGTVLFADMPFSIVSLLGAIFFVGASLGAKSTIYDYLSGLVLALEQPIRNHDCIEVGDQAGFVEEIRGRYTRVRRFDGIDILVPNSKFLEEEVVNWTLKDAKLRGDFKVGVRYNSDVNETMDILIDCLEDNDQVMPDPSPSVLFWDFGDNALVFRLFFWMEAKNPLEIWSVASKLRREIFTRLKESGITVAYPQRDVHLDAASPVEVVVKQLDTEKISKEQGEEPPREPRPAPEQDKKRDDSERVAEPETSKKEDDEQGEESRT